MARALRIEYEEAFYHVAARGNERKRIFFAKSDYGKFKMYLKKVNIPKSEITLYYIEATADIDNSEDEFKEDNNSASILRVIDQDCE